LNSTFFASYASLREKNAKYLDITENEISKIIVDTSFKLHTRLGPGLFESVYEEILYFEFRKLGLYTERQKPIPVMWEELKMEQGFRADLIIENKVLIEVKSIESIAPVHHKQVLTYLRLTDLKLGLLINFNEALIKEGIKRIVNNL
jgi:GxxExxY protein